jgi:hypothetical protein
VTPSKREESASVGGIDVERLAVAMNDAQIDPQEIRLGRDLRVVASRIAQKYAASLREDGDWPFIDGPMAGATTRLRAAYPIVRVTGADEGEYRRTRVDIGKFEYRWVRR